jgi:hypothetical protein
VADDLIAILALGLQYFLLILLLKLRPAIPLPLAAVIVVFLVLVGIGIVLWHREKLAQTVRQWQNLAARSVVLGMAFFGGDCLIALLHGQPNPFRFPGGLLGLPLTFLICPGGTIICLAGLVRAAYINRKAATGHPPH